LCCCLVCTTNNLSNKRKSRNRTKAREAVNAISEKYEIRQIFVFPASDPNDIWVNMLAVASN